LRIDHVRQWFAKRKSVAAILKEVMTNEASALLDTDAHNKAMDADAALQELGSDEIYLPLLPSVSRHRSTAEK
jgi:type IV secretory pathway VirB4 component